MKKKVASILLVLLLTVVMVIMVGPASATSIEVDAVYHDYNGNFWWDNVDYGPCLGNWAMIWVNNSYGYASCLGGGGKGWAFKGLYPEGGTVYHYFSEPRWSVGCVKAACLSPPPPVEYTDTDYIVAPRPTPAP